MEGYHVKFYRLNIVDPTYSTVQKQVDSPLQVSILDSQFLCESRIENKLSGIESRIESRRTENKRFTHD